jgi:hypothetical protein
MYLFHPRSYPERDMSGKEARQVDVHNVKRFHLLLEHKAAASAISEEQNNTTIAPEATINIEKTHNCI